MMKIITLIRRMGLFAFSMASVLLTVACSSHIPPEIRQAPAQDPGVAQVRTNVDRYLSQKIRWGGVILNIEHKQNASWLTIVARPLNDDGQPTTGDHSPGRFIAVVNEFLEPMVYKQDREITVTGQLIRTETLKVGEFDYEYPLVQVDHHYLWPARIEPDPLDYYPYWHYYPHYPWHPYYFPDRYYR
ncbi:MAG: Slp family lipoprotein [Gammaproteobacteria bacterium]|nr:Slp family lipoprotein [Gammaproteobacteria bacterium]